ncbi:MAG: HIT family protein [Nocardioidaceae bacterium]|nr:HIT family protein [Nocardioidaceae bacterium]
MSCLFCAIVSGAEPAHHVLDEEHVIGFLDVRPVFKGHVLLVPRVHHETLPDLPGDLLVPLFGVAQRVASSMVEVLGAHGSFVAVNNTVSQSAPHLHVHVVPRRRKDGLRGFFWPRTRYDGDEAEDYADRLRTVLA